MLPKKRKWLKIFFLVIMVLIFSIYILTTLNASQNINYSELKEKINFLSNNNVSNGKTYYVASDGISLDGTDINSPMSLETANKKTFYGNDKVLLKRGDTFFNTINFNIQADENNLVYIGSYGDENLEKPIISGANIIENLDAWEKSKDYENVYTIDLSNYNNFIGIGSNTSSPYNIGFIEDENGNIFGDRKQSLSEITENYDFFCDNNLLYLKLEKNPKELGKIKFATTTMLVRASSNSILDGLIIQNTGAHGISKKDEYISNVYIKNCILQNIGGGLQKPETFTRYGNAIEFWNQSNNTVVEKCIIRNIYDAGYTLQGNAITSTKGYENNICRDNIFINCSYPIEIFGTNNGSIENIKFKNNVISNNIIINQGRGWGTEVRQELYSSANLVVWTLPNTANGINFCNNIIYNSWKLYYRSRYTTVDTYKKFIVSDKNTYYLNSKTVYFMDEYFHSNKEILSTYDVDKNSSFTTVSNNEIDLLSDKKILNSNNYDRIFEYYNNFDAMYKSKSELNDIINEIKKISDNAKYSTMFENESVKENVKNCINNIEQFYQDFELSNKNNLKKIYNGIYEIINTIINEAESNNIEYFTDYKLECILNDIEKLNEKFKKVFSYYILKDDISSNEIAFNLNDTINKYNTNTTLMSNARNFILESRDLYLENIQNKDAYLNYLNKNRILNLCNISKTLMQYNNNLEEEKSKIKLVYNQDKNKSTTKEMIVKIEHGENTKIINNEGNNMYTFYKNGSFTFNLSIKSKIHALAISIKNIENKGSTNINVMDLNKKEVKSSQIELVGNLNTSNTLFLIINHILIILVFIILSIIFFIKYKTIIK